MSEEGNASSPPRRGRRRRVFGTVLYVLVGVALVVWEVKEGDLYKSESCDLKTSAPDEGAVMTRMYKGVLTLASLKESQQVSTVAIESDLQQIQSNVCSARAFTADLLDAIAAQQPKVIAIDKFYSKTACPPDDPDTRRLLDAVASLKVPVVVGVQTHNSEQSNSSSCIVISPQLFTPVSGSNGLNASAGPAVVYRGLTRLNEDPLKIPLQWVVFAKDADKDVAQDDSGSSFALVTTELMNPALKNDTAFRELIQSPQQPYADVADPLQKETATDLLCSSGKPDAVQRWGLNCKPGTKRVNLQNKVVVIGAESSADSYTAMGRDVYGFELQAHYIAALLGGAYLRDIWAVWLLLALVLYFVGAEILLPYMQIRKRPVWPLWHVKYAVLWEAGLFCVTMLVGFFVPLWFHRFPPLGLMLVVAGIFVARMLIELWALLNESTEEEDAKREFPS